MLGRKAASGFYAPKTFLQESMCRMQADALNDKQLDSC